jgi:TolA-binding protein
VSTANREKRARARFRTTACAALMVLPLAAYAGEPVDPAPAAAAGAAFETARLLPAAERLPALDRLDAEVGEAMRHGGDDRTRSGMVALSGAIRFERGDFEGAGDAWRRVAKNDGPFSDDAEFAAIRSLEARGNDAEAAKAWGKWEQANPKSPLLAEAWLAQAWNAIRRGDTREATNRLTALDSRAPWLTADPRAKLARASVLYLGSRPAEALAALGPAPAGPAALYLAALCHSAMGARLRAAATFQDVADHWPDSPLHDLALFAKAEAFLDAKDDRSAAAEFARVAPLVHDDALRGECELRMAGAVFLSGRTDSALTLMRGLVERRAGTSVAARAQFLVGEALVMLGKPNDAILEYNRVLTTYFQHSVASGAQYRVGRCLDALGRRADATGSYQAVVNGYPQSPEAPAAAYLAGVGMLAQGKPRVAAPYFQLVIDRYAARRDSAGFVLFARREHQEMVEAALCMLEVSYYRAGDLGQMSGAPHLVLERMPPSRSPWRAWSMLLDADAAASQARYPEAQATLERLNHEYPDHPVGSRATQLLAWTYARQGRDSLAIDTEERLIARWGEDGDARIIGGAVLGIAQQRFNQKRYRDAASAYDDFLKRYPEHPARLQALYQAGLCYMRLERAGDAIDRWERIVRDSADAGIAERAWARAGDVYFQAERYEDARRCYRGLLEHFAGSPAAGLATLRLGQCAYNAGHDDEALEFYAQAQDKYPDTPAAREAKRGTELALYRLSRSPQGSTVLARLVDEFPGSALAADAQFQIARRAYQDKRFRDAADGFRSVVSGFPGYSGADQAQLMLADACQQAGAPAEAEQAWQQFLSFFPTSPLRSTVQFRLGMLAFDRKDWMQAGVAFTAVLAETTTTEVASASRYNLALCQRLLGRPEDARAELERYRTEFPGDARAADVAFQLGDLHESTGRPDDAIAEFERALAAGPRPALLPELGFRLGRCREQKGDATGALAAYRRASESGSSADPFRLSAVARSAALYENRHEYTRALAAYRDLIAHARDRELVAAATGRVQRLEANVRSR